MDEVDEDGGDVRKKVAIPRRDLGIPWQLDKRTKEMQGDKGKGSVMERRVMSFTDRHFAWKCPIRPSMTLDFAKIEIDSRPIVTLMIRFGSGHCKSERGWATSRRIDSRRILSRRAR